MLEEKILGQNRVINYFKKVLSEEKIHHNYLFAGPKGVGKFTLAKSIAKILNCRNSQSLLEFCGGCKDCIAIENEIHPNFKVIRKTSDFLKLEDALKVKFQNNIDVFESGIKVTIVNEVDNLTEEAANSLLKVLEEPQEKHVNILISDNISKVLPTILSRSHIVRFGYIKREIIEERIYKETLDHELSKEISYLASGSFHRAYELLLRENRTKIKELHKLIVSFLSENKPIFVFANEYEKLFYGTERKDSLKLFLNTTMKILVDILLVKEDKKGELISNFAFLEDYIILNRYIKKDNARKLVHYLASGFKKMKMQVKPEVIFYNSLLRLKEVR